MHFFMARVPPDGIVTLDEGELAEWGWFTLEAAAELPMLPATQAFIAHLIEEGGAPGYE